VERFKDVPHFAAKLAIESALLEFDLPFTIIRPNYFFQNDGTLKDVLLGAGLYPMALGRPGISAVDVRDIAEAADSRPERVTSKHSRSCWGIPHAAMKTL
jgi:uncharacterized protein YbjT (DUF2867 family)